MKRFLEALEKAETEIKTTDHLIYITFPLVREKSLLIKSLISIKNSIVVCINLILQYEYFHKRIELFKDTGKNFRTFKEKCSRRYSITENELRIIEEIFNLVEMHKKSPVEFMKNEKVVILSESMSKKSFDIERIKKFLETSKEILKKTKRNFKK